MAASGAEPRGISRPPEDRVKAVSKTPLTPSRHQAGAKFPFTHLVLWETTLRVRLQIDWRDDWRIIWGTSIGGHLCDVGCVMLGGITKQAGWPPRRHSLM